MTSPAAPGPFGRWCVVVPVKGGVLAKSRLRRPPEAAVLSLADAFGRDTLACAAAAEPGRLVVVTSDPATSTWAADAGADVVADPGTGLDGAARAGESAARTAGAGAVAVLLGDHPALRPDELAAALTACAAYPLAFVPDADGSGTALLTASGAARLRPRFGAGSAALHEAAGHQRLDLDLPGLRCDVDDRASLAQAVRLGVGRHTASALGGTLRDVQASVHAVTGEGGSALLDDGREVRFTREVFARSGLRHLRVGQRVSVELGGDGRTVTRLWVVGIGEGETIR